MGAVYRAVDQALGRPVAIKVMLRSVAADRVFFEQFKREARAAAALSHPNIVQVFSLDEEKGQSYIVMELLSGGRLDHIISKKKRLDEAEMLRVGLDVAEGLSAAHGVGLIHDDIKPENILFDSKGVAKVVDFGLARFRGKGPQAGQNEIWGTPYYIAPEKVLRKNPDFRSDIYSLGGTLFHALTGRPHFEGETAVDVVKARIQGPAPDVRTFRPEVRPAVAALLASMLEREPEKRPASYAVLIDEMRKLAGIEPPKTSPIPGAEPAQKSTKILIKGKKKLSTVSSEPAAAEAEAETKPKKKIITRKVLLIGGIILGVSLLSVGVIVLMMRRADRQTEAGKQAQLAKDRGTADSLLAEIQSASTGVLANAEMFFFHDVEATGSLAKARAILDGMGENAKLVTIPVLPTEGDVAKRVEGPVLQNFSNLTNLESYCAEAERIRAEIGKAKPGESSVRAGLVRLREIREGIPSLAMSLAEADKVAAKIAVESADFIRQAESAREAGVKEAERTAAETAARKKREAEEAEKKRLQAEKQAKIAAELEKIKTAWGENAERISKNQFGDAAEALKRSLARLDTEEGTAEAKTVIDRCLLLQEMKEYLIEAIQAKPLRWGWFTTSGQIDISGANEAGVQVRGKTEPWSAVDVRQMLKFIDIYVKSEDAREKKGKRGWGRLHMAAALYCYLQGEKAYAVARTYADVAIAQDPKLEGEVKRLMPDLPRSGS
jgi:hypothetical protein